MQGNGPGGAPFNGGVAYMQGGAQPGMAMGGAQAYPQALTEEQKQAQIEEKVRSGATANGSWHSSAAWHAVFGVSHRLCLGLLVSCLLAAASPGPA